MGNECSKDIFREIGEKAGYNVTELRDMASDHVWDGGDPRDMKWVEQALNEMGVREDIAKRWLNRWGSYLGIKKSSNIKVSLIYETGGRILFSCEVPVKDLSQWYQSKDGMSFIQHLSEALVQLAKGSEDGDGQ